MDTEDREDPSGHLQDDAGQSRWRRVGPLILAAVFLAFSFRAVLFPLAGSDIWWHLASGRYMVQEEWPVYKDPFSYAPEQADWINLHWGFQLGAYFLYSLAGIGGLIIAKGIIFAAGCGLLIWSCRDRKLLPWAMALMSLLVFYVKHLVPARPLVISLLLLAVFILTIEKYRKTGRRRILWVLPAVQILWTNTQGLFILGPLVMLCYLTGEALSALGPRLKMRFVSIEKRLSGRQARLLLWFFLGTLGACLLNPYGIRGLLLPFTLWRRIEPAMSGLYSWNVSENLPSWFIQQSRPWMLPGLHWFGLLGAGSFLLSLRRFSISRLLLFASFLYLGLTAERNIPLYFFVLLPVVVLNLKSFMDQYEKKELFRRLLPWIQPAGTAAALIIIIIGWNGLAAAARQEPGLLSLAPFRHPVRASELLEREPFEGNLFNSVRYGGYLIWRLYPEKKVCIDGRLVIRSPETFREYLRILDEPERFHLLCTHRGITRVALPTAVFNRYLPLAAMLYHDPVWRPVYCDGSSALFALEGTTDLPRVDLFHPADVLLLEQDLTREYRGNPFLQEAAKRHLGAFLLYIGSLELAEKVLKPLHSAESRRRLARCYYFQGRPEKALSLSIDLLHEDPRDLNTLRLMARIRLDERKPEEALDYLHRILEIMPDDVWALQRLEEIRRRLQPGNARSKIDICQAL